MKTNQSIDTKHRGAALITALLILLVLTVIGISALKTSSIQETIVGNMREQDLSFQATEIGITAAEATITNILSPPLATSSGANNKIYLRNNFGTTTTLYDWANSAFDTAVWNSTIATEYGTQGTVDLTEVNADPMFIIEEENFRPDSEDPNVRATGQGIYTYRITSRGEGKAASTVTLIQETYGVRY